MSFELDERVDTLDGEFPSFMPSLWEGDVGLNWKFIEENLDDALTKAVKNYFASKKLGDISIEFAHYEENDEDYTEIEHIMHKKLSDFDIQISVVDNCNDENYCGGIEITIDAYADWSEDLYHHEPYSAPFIALSTLETVLNEDEEFYNTIINDAYGELM